MKLGMELEEMLGELHGVSKALKIKTNAKKTIVMTIERQSQFYTFPHEKSSTL